jgi:hypothetical protein
VGEGWDGGNKNRKVALELLLKTHSYNIFKIKMKRIISGILLTYVLIRLISSCATEVPSGSVSNMGSGKGTPNDKTGFSIPVKIDTFRLDILPPSSGVQFFRDGIVFLSLSKNEEKMLSRHLSFGTAQAYYSEIIDSVTGQHMTFSPSASFPYPCEATAFANDFNTMYFTRISESDKREKIYHAESASPGNNQQGWIMDDEPLSFCKNGSNYSHPAVSVDGKIMIFASDSPESSGGMDLFITRKINEKWAEPKNLGIAINTEGNELFPSLDAENNLFFSSDGHSGSGGYDIFMSKSEGSGWGIPLNLTRHLNTQKDEVAFTMDRTESNQAFFTARQKSRNDEMQLYRLTPKKGTLTGDNTNLSKILYSLALSEIDSTEVKKIMGKLEAVRIRIDRIKADSIEASRTEAERANIARLKAESTEKARIEEERLRISKARTDSLAAAKLNALKFQTDKAKTAKMRADSLATSKLNAQKLETERTKAAKLRSDSIMAVNKSASEKLAAERARAAKVRNDSIMATKKAAERSDAERIRIAQIKADSIMAAKKESEKLDAMRIKAERLRLDSLEARRLEADRKANPDIITYKVQFLSTNTPKDKFFITVDGVVYNANEYFYLKEYRYTVGEFSTLEPAKYLQFGCRRSGYPQAFVVAFKNGKRSLDMGLFK